MINEFVATLRNTNFDRLLFSSVKFNVVTFIQKSRTQRGALQRILTFSTLPVCLARSKIKYIHKQLQPITSLQSKKVFKSKTRSSHHFENNTAAFLEKSIDILLDVLGRVKSGISLH